MKPGDEVTRYGETYVAVADQYRLLGIERYCSNICELYNSSRRMGCNWDGKYGYCPSAQGVPIYFKLKEKP